MSKSTKPYSDWNKRPFKVPEPEKVIVDVKYTFTISPKELHNQNTLACHMSKFKKTLTYPGVHLELLPELSKKSLRLHWHGTILFKSKMAIMGYYYYNLRAIQPWCTYEIDTIADKSIWETYKKKQLSMWKHLFLTEDFRYKQPLGRKVDITNFINV